MGSASRVRGEQLLGVTLYFMSLPRATRVLFLHFIEIAREKLISANASKEHVVSLRARLAPQRGARFQVVLARQVFFPGWLLDIEIGRKGRHVNGIVEEPKPARDLSAPLNLRMANVAIQQDTLACHRPMTRRQCAGHAGRVHAAAQLKRYAI